MKKKLLLGLTVLGAASMLCGFDSAETADSLYQKMLDATTDASGASMSMGMNLDAAINVSDGTTDLLSGHDERYLRCERYDGSGRNRASRQHGSLRTRTGSAHGDEELLCYR